MRFRILHQDDWLVAIDKPPGFQVHPPAEPGRQLADHSNCLFLLNRQLGKYVYPVHRLDRATSGVLLFALDSETAARIQNGFQDGDIEKTYYAVVRGWTPECGIIEHPVEDKPARTHYETLARIEREVTIGRYATARHSLVKVCTESGRRHQIRRHFAHLSHPLIGDTVYGDGRHNQYFRKEIGSKLLFLKAHSLSLTHPKTALPLRVESRWGSDWHRAFEIFGLCPFEG